MRAEANLENARLSIQKEVNDAYIQVQKRYEYALADYIEMQQARQSYIGSKARLSQSYYEYYNAMALLDNVVGK